MDNFRTSLLTFCSSSFCFLKHSATSLLSHHEKLTSCLTSPLIDPVALLNENCPSYSHQKIEYKIGVDVSYYPVDVDLHCSNFVAAAVGAEKSESLVLIHYCSPHSADDLDVAAAEAVAYFDAALLVGNAGF